MRVGRSHGIESQRKLRVYLIELRFGYIVSLDLGDELLLLCRQPLAGQSPATVDDVYSAGRGYTPSSSIPSAGSSSESSG